MGAIASDERLARRAANGDERALESIYKRYNEDLFRFCLAMTGNAQDAQDALQNAMVKVLRALPGEERQIKLKPWLYRIARNEAVEVLRRRRDNEELEADVPTIGTVAETAETRERLRGLLDDLEQLPERQRAALLMRELCGCDYAEIGDAFGTSPAVARQTLYEARLGLRELAEGRECRCAEVRREISNGDGRVLRRRRTRAHLRDCPDCRAFQEAIAERERALTGIAPLPLAASAGLLQAVLGAQASGAGSAGAAGAASAASAGGGVSGLAETLGAGVGPTLATSAALKSVATVAVAVVAVTAADRTGVVDLPLAGGDAPVAAHADSHSHAHRAASPGGATGTAEERSGGGGGVRDDAQGAATAGAVGEDAGSDGGDPDEGGSTALGGHPASTPGHKSSEPGVDPPGGGYGKPAGGQGEGPDGPPAAAAKGQETASSHKPSQAPTQANPPAAPPKPAKPAPGPPQGSPEPPVTPPASTPPHASPPQQGPPAKAAPTTPSAPPAKGGQGNPSPQGNPHQPSKP